nr:hypothetical protein [Microbacterium bovistercoris]
MADYQDYYAAPIALNPDTGELQGNAEFAVYLPDDLSFETPLTVTDAVSGAALSPLSSSSIGTLPDFRATGDPPQVILKSGTFTTKLTSVYGAVIQAGLDHTTVQAAIDAAAGVDDVRTAAEAARDAAAASVTDAEAARDTTLAAVSDAEAARDGAVTAQTAAEAAQTSAEAAATPEAIAQVVTDYLDEHPVEGATDADVAGFVEDEASDTRAAIDALIPDGSDYATAAQGLKADSATQPDDLAMVATTGSYDDLTDKPSTFPPVIGTGATDALAGDTEIPSTAADVGAVPTTRTVNGKPLSADVVLSASDVGAYVKPGPGVPATDLVTAVQTSLGKADTALQAADLLVAVTAVTANYTLVLTDGGKAVEMSNSSARTITVPPNSSVAFPTGTVIECVRMGAGAVTIAAGAGVTIRNAAAVLTLHAQYSIVSLRKLATDEWIVTGDLG